MTEDNSGEQASADQLDVSTVRFGVDTGNGSYGATVANVSGTGIDFADRMENGAPEEAEAFSKRVDSGEINTGIPVLKALGYKQLLGYINGDLTREQAIEQAQAKTRQYAKQQVTWFRHQLK